MRRFAVLLLALSACSETSVSQAPPMDRFLFPVSLAATPAGSRTALLVASSNYDLHYDGASGGTVLSVDPALQADGGSAGLDHGLVKWGEGVRIGSFAGQMVAADSRSCPGLGAGARLLVPTRYDGVLNVLPLAADGSIQPCPATGCKAALDPLLHDPWSVTLACRQEVRRDATRRSVFLSYQETADKLGYAAGSGWLEEFDLDDLSQPGRTLVVGATPILDAAYDASRDRLVAVGRARFLTAPMFVVDLPPCRIDGSPRAGTAATGACPQPQVHSTDVDSLLPGADVQAVALSNPQAGLGRRAYVAARLYDPALGAILGGRPGSDVSAALLVMDLEDNLQGRPALTILRIVPVGLGAAQVRVLPQRPPLPGGAPRRDLVVVSSSTEGVLTVYDDDEEVVARAIHLEPATGAPQGGRLPFGLALDPGDPAVLGTPLAPVSRVYVAAYEQSVVSLLDVPLLAPGQAHLVRSGADGLTGTLVRIGGLQ
jgi:hypothetical protein